MQSGSVGFQKFRVPLTVLIIGFYPKFSVTDGYLAIEHGLFCQYPDLKHRERVGELKREGNVHPAWSGYDNLGPREFMVSCWLRSNNINMVWNSNGFIG